VKAKGIVSAIEQETNKTLSQSPV